MDVIDVIGSKVNLIEYCVENKINIISSMGFGNKMHPEMVEIAKIKNTSVCPMARTIRSILKKKKIINIPVVYSREIPVKPDKSELFKEELPTEFRENNEIPRKTTPGSNSFGFLCCEKNFRMGLIFLKKKKRSEINWQKKMRLFWQQKMKKNWRKIKKIIFQNGILRKRIF